MVQKQALVTVKGRGVYSNKILKGIEGDVVTFTDGSWVNVMTGKTHNIGKGFLTVDKPTKSRTKQAATVRSTQGRR